MSDIVLKFHNLKYAINDFCLVETIENENRRSRKMRVQISQGFKSLSSQDKPFLMKRSHCKNTVYDNKFTYTNVLEMKKLLMPL